MYKSSRQTRCPDGSVSSQDGDFVLFGKATGAAGRSVTAIHGFVGWFDILLVTMWFKSFVNVKARWSKLISDTTKQWGIVAPLDLYLLVVRMLAARTLEEFTAAILVFRMTSRLFEPLCNSWVQESHPWNKTNQPQLDLKSACLVYKKSILEK